MADYLEGVAGYFSFNPKSGASFFQVTYAKRKSCRRWSTSTSGRSRRHLTEADDSHEYKQKYTPYTGCEKRTFSKDEGNTSFSCCGSSFSVCCR